MKRRPAILTKIMQRRPAPRPIQRDFEAEFIARLQKLDARLNQLVLLSKKSP
jgi:hypothetical protein